jgi:LuxR family maltose regulon positive regulatory protein
VPEAITHWLAAGRTHEASQLVHANWLGFVDAGRAATVVGWLDTLGPDDTPPAHTTAAWIASLVGDEHTAARHLRAVEGSGDYGPLPDGSRSVESATAQLRGLFGYGGPLEMMAAARRATELERDGRSAHFAIAQAALGHAHYVQGELDQCLPPLRAATLADQAPGMIRILALSLECFAESERGNPTRARECAEQAMEVLDRRGLGAAPQASWAYVALAQAQADAGKSDDAMRTLELGLSTRRLNNAQAVWGPIHHLLVSARIAAHLGHDALARELLAELTQRMSRFTDGMTAMRERADAVRKVVNDHDALDLVGEPLTERELDVLRMLQGSLSLHEIAVELYLSANTVKSHARAVYRKLGAHSRADAVRVARERSLV